MYASRCDQPQYAILTAAIVNPPVTEYNAIKFLIHWLLHCIQIQNNGHHISKPYQAQMRQLHLNNLCGDKMVVKTLTPP